MTHRAFTVAVGQTRTNLRSVTVDGEAETLEGLMTDLRGIAPGMDSADDLLPIPRRL